MTSPNPPTHRKRALLIGIRTYPNVSGRYGKPLAGCHNDVAAMHGVLVDRGFDDLRVLVDPMAGCGCRFCGVEDGVEDSAAGETVDGSTVDGSTALPTRQGILDAVARLVDDTDPGDVAVIYYSGHGSEIRGRGLFSGQRFQTLVPHDSGRGEAPNRDILDREIQGWLSAFAAKTPYLTLIFDCCHSGGTADLRGEAAAAPGVTGVRQVEAEERGDGSAFSEETRAAATVVTRGGERSAIVLSASAAHELSAETLVRAEGEGTDVGDGLRHGLFTSRLVRALRQRTAAALRWSDLFADVAREVTERNVTQHPRREGDGPLFEPGALDLGDIEPPDVVELHKLAVVIGIDYREPPEDTRDGSGFTPLRTPVADAEEVARVLEEEQGYEIVGLSKRSPGPLLNGKANRRRIHKLLQRLIDIEVRSERHTGVLIYFAGHGLVHTDADGRQAGYLVPWGADPEDPSTWLPMADLRDHLVDGIHDPERLTAIGVDKGLDRLHSRHLLLVLDCCFGGALSFDFFRGDAPGARPIYYSEYKRFVEGQAWQMLTSASHNQRAMDRNPKDPDQPYSPFAQAFLDGLASGDADAPGPDGRRDHVITVGELHQHIDARLDAMGVDIQSAGLTSLRPLQGQYIFHVPGYRPTPFPDPPLHRDACPWPGSRPYSPGSVELFCGRERETLDALDHFLALGADLADSVSTDDISKDDTAQSLTLVGPSGCGASSLLRAGLLPLLEDPVAGRRRLRAALQRLGWQHYRLDAETLESVRAWARELELHTQLDTPARLADTVRRWAEDADWITDSGQLENHMRRESVGMPSFAESSDASVGRWFSRLGILDLLHTPHVLADQLRLWLTEGRVIDFLTVPDKRLKRLVGRWTVTDLSTIDGTAADTVSNADTVSTADTAQPLWIVDDFDRADGATRGRVDQLLAHGGDGRLLLTRRVRGGFGDVPEPLGSGPGHRTYTVPHPDRDALRRVVTEPAAARLLTFEPDSLVDTLVDTCAESAAPLAWLSRVLESCFLATWKRHDEAPPGSEPDRTLRGPQHPSLEDFLAHGAEAIYRRVTQGDPTDRRILRSVLLRAVSQDRDQALPRPIPWDELDFATPETHRRFHDHLLPRLLDERFVVADAEHLHPAHPLLSHCWPRLRRWLRHLQRRPSVGGALLQRAREWQRSGHGNDKLWPFESALPDLLRSTTLVRLEWAFVVASDLHRRSTTVLSWASGAVHVANHTWPPAAHLAADALALALDTRARVEALEQPLGSMEVAVGGVAVDGVAVDGTALDTAASYGHVRQSAHRIDREGFAAAEQAVHRILGQTPLSVPLPPRLFRADAGTPRALTGMAFDADGRLGLRCQLADGAVIFRGFPTALGAPWEPEPEPSETEVPRSGEGLFEAHDRDFNPLGLRPQRYFPRLGHHPWEPKAQPAADGSIRFTRALPPLDLLVERPEILRGHRFAPTFLAFSPDHRWLASGANLPDGGIEVRLWPVDPDRGARWEPHSGRRLKPTNRRPFEELAGELGVTVHTPDTPLGPLDPDLEPTSRLPGQVTALARSSDGARLAVGLLDGSVRLWSARLWNARRWSADGRERPNDSPPEPQGPPVLLYGRPGEECLVSHLAFSQDGQSLAVERQALHDPHWRRIDVHRLDPGSLIRLARGHAGPRSPFPMPRVIERAPGLAVDTTLGKEAENDIDALDSYLSALGLRSENP